MGFILHYGPHDLIVVHKASLMKQIPHTGEYSSGFVLETQLFFVSVYFLKSCLKITIFSLLSVYSLLPNVNFHKVEEKCNPSMNHLIQTQVLLEKTDVKNRFK